MIKLLIIVLLSVSLFSCATCPTEKVYLSFLTPTGNFIGTIDPGYLDNPENYKNQEQYDVWLEKQYEKFMEMMEKEKKQGGV